MTIGVLPVCKFPGACALVGAQGGRGEGGGDGGDGGGACMHMHDLFAIWQTSLSLGEDRSGTPNPKLKLWVCEWEYEDEEDEEEACWSFWGVVGSAKGILVIVVLDQFSITYYNASAPSRTDIVICYGQCMVLRVSQFALCYLRPLN